MKEFEGIRFLHFAHLSAVFRKSLLRMQIFPRMIAEDFLMPIYKLLCLLTIVSQLLVGVYHLKALPGRAWENHAVCVVSSNFH